MSSTRPAGARGLPDLLSLFCALIVQADQRRDHRGVRRLLVHHHARDAARPRRLTLIISHARRSRCPAPR
jgi:hypothetical protein